MPGVGARLRQHVDLPARRPSIFGAVLSYLHPKLRNRVDYRHVTERVVVRIRVDDPIQQVRRVVGPASRHAQAGHFALAHGVLLHRHAAGIHSRRKHRQLKELAPVER